MEPAPSQPDITPDPESMQAAAPTVDQAYSAAGPRSFGVDDRGQPQILQPWTGRRRTAAFELGMKGDGSILDPIRMLYSCVMKQSDVFMTFRRPDQVIQNMLNWAEKNECLDPTMKNYKEAADLAMQIMNEVDMSAFKSEGDGTPTGN